VITFQTSHSSKYTKLISYHSINVNSVIWPNTITFYNKRRLHVFTRYIIFGWSSHWPVIFQCCLFLRKATLLSWLKWTLLLKNKCFFTTIYMKTQSLQTNKMQHYWERTMLEKQEEVGEIEALIKSLIYVRWKSCTWGAVAKLSRQCQLIH